MNFINKWLNKRQVGKNKKQVGQARLRDVLKEQLPTHKVFPLDGIYYVPEHSDFMKMLKKTKVDEIKYLSEKFDCESFSFYLHSILALNYNINSCGIVISYESGHAFNIIVTHKSGILQTYILEPQDDKIWKPEDNDSGRYIIENQIILI